ncbi:uncharacterized protein LOC141906884 isoform X2 [Tubulanus polymorphus]|uniref:uncharacterized protein LOC141906884 isoform X2 n=1 Tax=Tubulanus polymorphus TaxID=672921 RepID=UPI003DA2DBFC
MRNQSRNLQQFELICVILLLILIPYSNSPQAFRLFKRNTAPDGVVLDSVNVLPDINMLLSQEGKTVSITCKQSSSTATGVHFQLQVNSGAGGTWTPIPLGISTVWKIVPEAGKQYKCVATNSAGTKESQIYQSDVISIKINENPCKLHEFKPSLACTCEATSKIGNPNIKVKWYADGYRGSKKIEIFKEQGVNTALKDGLINRNQMYYLYKIDTTLTQCRLWNYNGIELPEPLQKQILHQTKMDVTYFPDEILTNDTYTGQPDIRTEGEVVEYICRTEGGRPDPTVIYQQKRRGSEQWEPIPDPQPRKVPLKGTLKGFDTTYKFNADFKLHNGTSFRCAVEENLTFPEPQQFNPIIVHHFAAPVYKKSSENKTNAAYIVTVNSYPLTQQVTCDPPAVVQKLSTYQWNITIPIVNSTTTDYRGRCLADGINERVIDVAGYHNAGPTDDLVSDGGYGGRVFGAVIGVLILVILIILFILWRRGCLTCKLPTADEPDNKDDSSDELCHCCCLLLRREPCTCDYFTRLGPESKDVIELLRWTSETWYRRDHENWVKTRDQLQPETVRIIVDVYGTENNWEITRDKDKQAKAIKEFLFGQLSSDQSMLNLVKKILRKYATINNLKMKLSNEIDILLNKKRSIDGADAVYNRDEDEVHVSFMTQLDEEKRPLTDKEKEFIRDVASAVESIVDFFAKMSDAELCERGIFNIKPTAEIAEKFVKETLQTEVKQQNGKLVTQIENQKVTDETKTEMGVADRNRFVNKDICESVLLASSLQKLEENKHSTELDKSIYEIGRDVLEIKLKIVVFESIKELFAGRAERFQKELKEKLKQEENEERKNEEELNRIIHSSVCQAFKCITDMNEKTLMDNKVVRYGVSPEEINSKLHELADKEFESRKLVGYFNRIKTPEEILPLKLNIPAQLRTELDSADRHPVILWDRAVEYFKDEFIIAIQSDESLKTATQTALDNKSSEINDLLRKENLEVVDRIYVDVKNRMKSIPTEELKQRGIVVYRIKDVTARIPIKRIIKNRIPQFKDSLEPVLKEKCKEASGLSANSSMNPITWIVSKQWEYDISTAMSELSEFTSTTLKTNTGYWKLVRECFGDEIDSETNTTELTKIVHECLGKCAKTMCDKWSFDDFKNHKMIKEP